MAGALAAGGCWLAIGSTTRRRTREILAASARSRGGPRGGRQLSGSALVVIGFVALGASVSGPLLALAMGSAAAFGALRLSTRRARPGDRTSSVERGDVPRGLARVMSGSLGSRTPSSPVRRHLPAALDLIAACMAAGASAERALTAVGAAFDGEIGDVLAEVARLATLGAPIETAWAKCLRDPRLAPVARAVIRAHHSGAALTDVLTHLADDRRRALRSDAQVAAQRAGVAAVLPLGVCFLPAFVLVGVVPVVAGFARALWS